MNTRLASIAIVVETPDSVAKLNDILSQYGEYIIGRMGIPYHKKKISVISVVIDAPENIISALCGKLGMLPHVSAKAVYSKQFTNTKADDDK